MAQKFRNEAKVMMLAHSLAEVFITSDAQGFKDLQRAEDHSRYLSDKNIEHYIDNNVNTELEAETPDTDSDLNQRLELVAKYEKLFGKKPAHNLGITKLQLQIQEKEKEDKNTEVEATILLEEVTVGTGTDEQTENLNED
ncbi:hypothetical protein [Flavobacterium sp. HSC-61S13]|uniref:hypothetical protein n=1 Tax=Flavobacterium sp. HSC-61S13 TaxID=2910963 RepID=UPI0020A1DC47|nr:hypothetical protein [Flavobacterium sp. HSC-61S13]MCP1997298.1 hypothetical protein [Flavobacterium sp. HSC-61S13]